MRTTGSGAGPSTSARLADRLAEVIADIGTAAHDGVLLRTGDRDGQHLAERRRAVELSQPDLRAVKRVVILPRRLPDGLVRGRECLDNGPAGRITAAAAADDLRDERKRALIGAVIATYRLWSALSTPTSVTFSKFSPFVIICVPIMMGMRSRANRCSSASCVPAMAMASASMRSVSTPGNSAWRSARCAPSRRRESAARRRRPALRIDPPAVAAVVADEHLVALMIRQADAAVRARIGRAALGAGDDLARAAPVEKQDALLAAAKVLLQLAVEHGADRAGIAIAQFLLHVGDDHVRQLAGVNRSGSVK